MKTTKTISVFALIIFMGLLGYSILAVAADSQPDKNMRETKPDEEIYTKSSAYRPTIRLNNKYKTILSILSCLK